MSKLLQVFYFICYGLAAVAIAYMAPKIFPETPHSVAWLAGAVVFLAGALMHEIASRCYQASLDRHRLAVLHRAYTEAMDDIDRLATEVRALKRTGLASVSPPPAEVPMPEPPAMDPVPEAETPEPVAPSEPDVVVRPDPVARRAVPEANTPEGRLEQALLQRLYSPAELGQDGMRRGAPLDGRTAVVSGSLIERETLGVVRDGLRQNNVRLYVQPIVTLPQRKPRHFDCEARLDSESGDFMPPALYNEILVANGLKLPVDNMFLFRMMQLIEAGPAPEPGAYYFCEIAPDILSDRSFIPAFLDYLRSADDLVSRVAFEFREADLIDMDEAGADSLGTLVDLGFHLCVSQLSNVDVEAERLVEGGVRFVKIEAEVPMAAITNDAEAARMRRFTSALDDAGIELIVTGIANEQLLVEILDFDIEYGQGPLFGDPRKQSAAPAAAAEGRRGRA